MNQPMPGAYPYPYQPAPPAPNRWPAWRIADLVGTIVLFGMYAVGLLALLYFSVFWAMATDSCSAASNCDYGKLDTAFVLNDICGIIVFLVSLIAGIVLLVLRKPAFWLPLLGGLIQIGLFVAAMHQLSGINPA